MSEKTYRAMCVPHESPAELDARMTEFFDEVRALRVKYRIADLCVITKAFALSDDDEPAAYRSSIYLGSSIEKVGLLAQTYGEAKAELERALSRAANPGPR